MVQDQLSKLVARAVLDLIRQSPRIDFWEDSIEKILYEGDLQRWLGLPKDHEYQLRSLVAAVKQGGKSYRTFDTRVTHEAEHERHKLTVDIQLKNGFEWREALEEAWENAPVANEYLLSDNSLKILNWLRSDKFDGKPLEMNKLGRRANLRGSYRNIDDCLREIQAKSDTGLQYEQKMWNDPVKIWFEQRQYKYYDIGPLNPPLQLITFNMTGDEIKRFRNWLYETIRNIHFVADNEVVGIFDIRERNTLKQCLRHYHPGYRDAQPRHFFDAIRLIDGIEFRYKFNEGAGPWLVICQLKQGWKWSQIQKRLKEMANEIPLQKKYNLSPESSALLKWIQELRQDEFLNGLTPPIEEHLKVDIGIKTDWPKENLPALIGLLVEEINEKTEYELRTLPWKYFNEHHTRILVKRKLLELEKLVQLIQIYGLSRNQVLESAIVKDRLKELF